MDRKEARKIARLLVAGAAYADTELVGLKSCCVARICATHGACAFSKIICANKNGVRN